MWKTVGSYSPDTNKVEQIDNIATHNTPPLLGVEHWCHLNQHLFYQGKYKHATPVFMYTSGYIHNRELSIIYVTTRITTNIQLWTYFPQVYHWDIGWICRNVTSKLDHGSKYYSYLANKYTAVKWLFPKGMLEMYLKYCMPLACRMHR